MGVKMESEFRDCVAQATTLSPRALNRNCRRAGFYAILIAAVGFKYEIFDVLIKSMQHSSVEIDHFMVFVTGAQLAMGLMLLYGGRTFPRLLEPNKYTGKFGISAVVTAAIPVFAGVLLDLYFTQSVNVCLNGSFVFK